MQGQTLGSYRIVEKLGQGGMGVVYRAEHNVLGRPVAIKMLQPESSHDQHMVRRFFREARAAAAVRHPGIVHTLDFGTHTDGSLFIVMEYLQGETLRDRLRRNGRLSEAMARRLARQVALAVGAAHAHRIIHRDLKPDNLYLVRDEDVVGGERVKVLDFGIARFLVETTTIGSVDRVVGSPAYMAPEQARAAGLDEIDERADVYSLGCVLFEMVCGRRPFEGAGLMDVLAKHLHASPPRPRQLAPELSEELETLILRMLAKRPDGRPASMQELAQLLDPVGDEEAASPAPLALTATLPPASPRGETVDATPHSVAVVVAPPPRRRSARGVLAALGAILFVGAGAIFAGTRPTREAAAEAPARATSDAGVGTIVPHEAEPGPPMLPDAAILAVADASLVLPAQEPAPAPAAPRPRPRPPRRVTPSAPPPTEISAAPGEAPPEPPRPKLQKGQLIDD